MQSNQVSIFDIVRNVMLVKGTDYTVNYTNNATVGTASIEIEGINNYEGTTNYSFTIVDGDHDIANAVVDQKSIFSKEYDGTKQTQDSLSLTLGGKN